MINHSKPWITENDTNEVNNVLKSGMISKGSKVREFEQKISDYLKDVDVVACNNGTSGISITLKALGIAEDDEVILPNYVCSSVYDSVISVGAKPILCDVGTFWTVTPESIESYITTKTKAIIIVHIFGISVNVKAFKKFNITIIEDCCQAFGAKYDGEFVGTIGDVGILSFHATKCLTTGEGGAIISKNENLISDIRKILNQNIIVSTMSDMQAALGISQINRYDEFLIRRRYIAEKYIKNIPDALIEDIKCIQDKTIFFRFLLSVNFVDFNFLEEAFFNKGVKVRRGVDVLLNKKFNISGEFSNSSKCFDKTVSIPIYPDLTEEEINNVITSVKEILGGDK